MKRTTTISVMFAVASYFGAVSVAGAATCNTTLGPISSTATVQGSNCGNNSNFNGATFCGGIGFSSNGTDAWAIQLGTGQSFTISVTSPGTAASGKTFNPDVALLGTCADNGSCVAENTLDTPTVTVPSSGTITGQTAGTYYIIVTDSSGTGNQCGTYDMSFTGTLPVKLEKFSVD
jgi:hypothetical protein